MMPRSSQHPVSRILPKVTAEMRNDMNGGVKDVCGNDGDMWEAVSFVRVSDAMNGILKTEARRREAGAGMGMGMGRLMLRKGPPKGVEQASSSADAAESLTMQFEPRHAPPGATEAQSFSISVYDCSGYDVYRGDLCAAGNTENGKTNELRHLGIVSTKMRIASENFDARFTQRFREEDRRKREKRTVILPNGQGAVGGEAGKEKPPRSIKIKRITKKISLDDVVYRLLLKRTYHDKQLLLESVIAELAGMDSPLREECNPDTIARALARVGEYKAPGRWCAKPVLPVTCAPIDKAEAQGTGRKTVAPSEGTGRTAEREPKQRNCAGPPAAQGKRSSITGDTTSHLAALAPGSEATKETTVAGARKPLPKCLDFHASVGISEVQLAMLETDDQFEEDKPIHSEEEYRKAARYFDERWKFYSNLDSWMLLVRGELKALPHFETFSMKERTDPALSVRAVAEAVRELKPLFIRVRDLRKKLNSRLGRLTLRLREFKALQNT